ncbi:Secreted protein (plasmid) [Streptomyces clavuligerus]|uniref:Secreted protein n=1 Tax=Streptomyces clavuligerus TaxID=1901 RepID=D5SJM6_STRCL|nr:Secreted protein [Streptomyces clavuligerus]
MTGPDGRAVTAFTPEHEKELHFIAVRRDTAGFQHVHPVRDGEGTWSVGLALEPGDWRFFADIHPAGHDGTLTLGIDVAVAGPYDPRPLPEATGTARVGAYTVTLDGGLLPGEASELTLTVSRDGRPVTDLQPYLAAYGHLVALRVGDLGYLHVHPAGEPGDGTTAPGPGIVFTAAAPSAGTYRLYLDFQHEDTVRTAGFTVRTGTAAATPRPAAEPPAAHPGHRRSGHAHH